MRFFFLTLAAIAFVAFSNNGLLAQGNYEIQVYGADTVPPHSTMLELHSNYTADGQRQFIDGVAPTNHA